MSLSQEFVFVGCMTSATAVEPNDQVLSWWLSGRTVSMVEACFCDRHGCQLRDEPALHGLLLGF